MDTRVFIHTNDKQLLGAIVSRYSLRKSSGHGQQFAVEIIHFNDFPALRKRHGWPYLREGQRAVWDNNDLQSFTPLRFLPPSLMNYVGRALVIDPDVFALADVWELLQRDMGGAAILARRICPKDGRSPYWASSVMLLDCSKLVHWQWEQALEEMFSMRRDYRKWMSLELEPPGSVAALDDEWNHFDQLDDATKLLHNTGRLTQPWKTGLPIDFIPKGSGRRHEPALLSKMKGRVFALLRGRPFLPFGYYKRHPDPRQEALFFRLLRECVEAGEISTAFLRDEIERRHVRPDAFELMNEQVSGKQWSSGAGG